MINIPPSIHAAPWSETWTVFITPVVWYFLALFVARVLIILFSGKTLSQNISDREMRIYNKKLKRGKI